MKTDNKLCKNAYFHLPGLFEFYEFYKKFLPLYEKHREYFYDWCSIGSIYGSPSDCIWGGGRTGFGTADVKNVLDLLKEFKISARLTFSNSLLKEEHIKDKKCNQLCSMFEKSTGIKNGIIIYSDLLLDFIQNKYHDFYFVSSITKVITDFNDFNNELNKKDFRYVVPDFRLNKNFEQLRKLTSGQKEKVEFLCNECCWTGCMQRKQCYENVSRKALGIDCKEFKCSALDSFKGYRFSKAMKNPCFISLSDIKNIYLPMGFTNFKIEGRSLGSALILEFLLYYMTKPEFEMEVREEIYLDNTLDLF